MFYYDPKYTLDRDEAIANCEAVWEEAVRNHAEKYYANLRSEQFSSSPEEVEQAQTDFQQATQKLDEANVNLRKSEQLPTSEEMFCRNEIESIRGEHDYHRNMLNENCKKGDDRLVRFHQDQCQHFSRQDQEKTEELRGILEKKQQTSKSIAERARTEQEIRKKEEAKHLVARLPHTFSKENEKSMR